MATLTPTPQTSAADLRAEIARQMVPVYHLAARVGLHPTHLGQMLRGRRRLTPEIEERLREALKIPASGDRNHRAA